MSIHGAQTDIHIDVHTHDPAHGDHRSKSDGHLSLSSGSGIGVKNAFCGEDWVLETTLVENDV